MAIPFHPEDNRAPGARGETRPAGNPARQGAPVQRPGTNAPGNPARPAVSGSAARPAPGNPVRPAGNPARQGAPVPRPGTNAPGNPSRLATNAGGNTARRQQPSGEAVPPRRPAAVSTGRPSRLTPEQEVEQAEARRRREAERQRMEEEKRLTAAKGREARRARQYRIVSGVLVLCLLVGVGLLVYYLIRQQQNRTPSRVQYQIGDFTYTMPYDAVTADGTMYLNFTDVARYLELSAVGDADGMCYLIEDGTSSAAGSGSEQSVLFTNGSDSANVNGLTALLVAPVIRIDGQLYVPVDFVNAHMTGVTVTVKGVKVTVTRDTELSADGKNAVPSPIAFSALRLIPWPEQSGTSTEGTENPPIILPTTVPDVNFGADLSAYESAMNPTGNSRDAYLMLINKMYTRGENDAPASLAVLNTAYTYNGRTVQMEETAARAMEAMFLEMFAAGYTDMHLTSGYRSYTEQKRLFEDYVAQEIEDAAKKGVTLSREAAEAFVNTYSARPGTSEHQSGLCADLHNLSSADQSFAAQPAYKWLLQNAWKFGFVLRFPSDKTEETGYSFEPWHWRFVGRYHAYRMWSAGLCLEEYIATIA